MPTFLDPVKVANPNNPNFPYTLSTTQVKFMVYSVDAANDSVHFIIAKATTDMNANMNEIVFTSATEFDDYLRNNSFSLYVPCTIFGIYKKQDGTIMPVTQVYHETNRIKFAYKAGGMTTLTNVISINPSSSTVYWNYYSKSLA